MMLGGLVSTGRWLAIGLLLASTGALAETAPRQTAPTPAAPVLGKAANPPPIVASDGKRDALEQSAAAPAAAPKLPADDPPIEIVKVKPKPLGPAPPSASPAAAAVAAPPVPPSGLGGPPPRPAAVPPPSPGPAALKGFHIQVGSSYVSEEQAEARIREVLKGAPDILAGRTAITQTVEQAGRVFHRARFAGFDKAAADAACAELTRRKIACVVFRSE
jgi:hypothetical protein